MVGIAPLLGSDFHFRSDKSRGVQPPCPITLVDPRSRDNESPGREQIGCSRERYRARVNSTRSLAKIAGRRIRALCKDFAMTLLRKNPNQASGTSPTIPCVWPRAMRPPLAALYIGGTAGLIEQLWRDGELPYKLVGGTRVALIEDLDKYVGSLEKKTGKLSERHPIAATEARRAA